MIGTTLGHYRITSPLGKAGMGEVYVADDLNLNRKVALKLLPDAFAGDPERMARFEREAKLLASLNHPNIAAIYGLEQAEGKRFLVLELVEGETLAQRISKGSLPIDETLELYRQMAEGLEAAHEKGVIHRDLKPANVMITEGGKVKILDFGLAKALSDETQSIDSSQSPTLTEAMTRPGVILGTAAYMSPEQAKGKSVDKRADIWAFGCILYECLTGKRAFEGETVTETPASVLTREPDWEKIPAEVQRLLRRCLEKDRKKRLRDIGDSFALLESAPVSTPVKRAWLAYVSDESGRNEVYVQAFPPTSERKQISSGGGADPQWRQDGTELFYLAADRKLMAVLVRAAATTFEPGIAKALFSIPGTSVSRTYSPSGDGRRFLIAKPAGEAASLPFTVVLNWQAGLNK
ncbi:MAG: protein kinase [Acidobacteria bacterium]|nr:protein kinase [Acidobacteriota bacterium]